MEVLGWQCPWHSLPHAWLERHFHVALRDLHPLQPKWNRGALPPSFCESPRELLSPGEGSAGRSDGGLGPPATGVSGGGSRVGLSPRALGSDAHPGSFGTGLNCQTQFGENATHPLSQDRSHRDERCPPSGTAMGQGTNRTL